MQRAITGFGVDEHDDPFAWLSCGHRQHVRHQPPFVNRPWVISDEGREAMLGQTLNCVRCDALEWPDGFVVYKQTPVFTEATVPAGLLRDHATKAGVWACIRVQSGQLRYCIPSLAIEQLLGAKDLGTVLPEVLHYVSPVGRVRFVVEFYRKSPLDARSSEK
ncbi:MAG TPA: DUF3565 domain-containing protein [Pseudomonadales bacterium]|jgi:tellurite resistance-related uncharacterized protein